jgi:hypothetical protein
MPVRMGGLPYDDFLIDIRRLYDKRSNIVHGGILEEDPVTLEDIRLIEPITRQIIFGSSNIIINNQAIIATTQELVEWLEQGGRQRFQVAAKPL